MLSSMLSSNWSGMLCRCKLAFKFVFGFILFFPCCLPTGLECGVGLNLFSSCCLPCCVPTGLECCVGLSLSSNLSRVSCCHPCCLPVGLECCVCFWACLRSCLPSCLPLECCVCLSFVSHVVYHVVSLKIIVWGFFQNFKPGTLTKNRQLACKNKVMIWII